MVVFSIGVSLQAAYNKSRDLNKTSDTIHLSNDEINFRKQQRETLKFQEYSQVILNKIPIICPYNGGRR